MTKDYFFHYRPEGGRPTTIYGVWEGDILKLSASTCSKSDQFTKKVGRENAKQRMNLSPQMVLHYDPKYARVGKSKFFMDTATGLGAFFGNFPHTLLPIK